MTWAEDSANIADPGAALKSEGYAFGDAIPSDEINWLFRDLYRRAGGTFLTSADALRDTPDAGAFSLPSLGSIGKGLTLAPTSLPAAGYGSLCCSDGARVYYADTALSVTALDAATGVLLWQRALAEGDMVAAIACGDGLVVVGHGVDDNHILTAIDASTGVVVGTADPVSLTVRRLSVCAGLIATCFVGDNNIVVYSAATLAELSTYDNGSPVFDVALRHDLCAFCGTGTDGGGTVGVLGLLDVSTPATPAEVWVIDLVEPTVAFCGWIGDAVLWLPRGGDDTARLYPVARFATAPAALATRASCALASGAAPAICDAGVAYAYAGSGRPLILSPRLEALCLAVPGSVQGLAWGGNVFFTCSETLGLGRISASNKPVRCAVQNGNLVGA